MYSNCFDLQDKQLLKENLETQSRQCQWIILWLDCDREGENICFEVRMIVQTGSSEPYLSRRGFSSCSTACLVAQLGALQLGLFSGLISSFTIHFRYIKHSWQAPALQVMVMQQARQIASSKNGSISIRAPLQQQKEAEDEEQQQHQRRRRAAAAGGGGGGGGRKRTAAAVEGVATV